MNYEELDKLCIPVIRILRETLGIETLFCCQGATYEERKIQKHSATGYIACKLDNKSEEVMIRIAKELGQQKDIPFNICSIQYRYPFRPMIVLRLKRLMTSEQIERVWKRIEEILTT